MNILAYKTSAVMISFLEEREVFEKVVAVIGSSIYARICERFSDERIEKTYSFGLQGGEEQYKTSLCLRYKKCKLSLATNL